MARKKTISGEKIINTGLQIIKREGIDFLNARHLAEEMGITTTPVYTNFGSMDNLLLAIWLKAKKECDTFLLKSLDYAIAFKEFGIRFLTLAIENPNLFKFVFLVPFSNVRRNEILQKDLSEIYKPVFDTIRNPYKLSENAISELIHILITFTSGLAMMNVVSKKTPSKAAYELMLTHLFNAICEYLSKHEDIVSKEVFEKLLNE